MYKCQVTGRFSKLGDKLNKLVIATRAREYKEKFFNEETRKMEEVVVGHGTEIVKEINASDEGAALWASMSEDDRAVFARRFMK